MTFSVDDIVNKRPRILFFLSISTILETLRNSQEFARYAVHFHHHWIDLERRRF